MDGHTVYEDGHLWGCDHDSVVAGPAFFTSLVSYPHSNITYKTLHVYLIDLSVLVYLEPINLRLS